MFIIGFVLFFLTIGFVLTHFSFAYVIDLLFLQSLIIVLVPLLCVMTATKSFKSFYVGIRAVILPKASISDELLGQVVSSFRFFSKSTALIAGIGFLLFLSSSFLLIDFSHPDNSSKAISILGASLTVPLYGLILITTVLEPVVFSLKKRREAELKN